jgi:hypothetical protein
VRSQWDRDGAQGGWPWSRSSNGWGSDQGSSDSRVIRRHRRPQPIASLEEHPNRLEILEVLAQLAMLRDDDLERLAKSFRNTPSRRDARDIALSPDSPLIIEVLSVFGAISTIFADDLVGEEDFVTVDPAVTAHALKAVRDAVAAAYARPILSRAQHRALMAPWRAVCEPTTQTEPDLGPADAEIRSILSGLPRLAYRCHDPRGQEAFTDIVDAAHMLDEDEHSAAVETALQAAVLMGRRRLWTLVRCNVAERLARRCPLGHARRWDEGPDDERRVLDLCGDAAGALLVSPALDPLTELVLVTPALPLLPVPARASGPVQHHGNS